MFGLLSVIENVFKWDIESGVEKYIYYIWEWAGSFFLKKLDLLCEKNISVASFFFMHVLLSLSLIS